MGAGKPRSLSVWERETGLTECHDPLSASTSSPSLWEEPCSTSGMVQFSSFVIFYSIEISDMYGCVLIRKHIRYSVYIKLNSYMNDNINIFSLKYPEFKISQNFRISYLFIFYQLFFQLGDQSCAGIIGKNL